MFSFDGMTKTKSIKKLNEKSKKSSHLKTYLKIISFFLMRKKKIQINDWLMNQMSIIGTIKIYIMKK